MPKYGGLDMIGTTEFFEKWRKDAFDESLYTLPEVKKEEIKKPVV